MICVRNEGWLLFLALACIYQEQMRLIGVFEPCGVFYHMTLALIIQGKVVLTQGCFATSGTPEVPLGDFPENTLPFSRTSPISINFRKFVGSYFTNPQLPMFQSKSSCARCQIIRRSQQHPMREIRAMLVRKDLSGVHGQRQGN